MAASSHTRTNYGAVVAIGGAEDKVRSRSVLGRVLELAGGSNARIAIISTASRRRETASIYRKLFMELGAAEADCLALDTRAHGHDPELVERLCRATCIFLTGGNQLRLSTILGGTPIARTIRRRNSEGVVVAGTSAGAAILSEHMIAYGNEGPTPRAGMVSLAPGFGLVNSVIIDQHFRQRDRIGRLLTALAYNPYEIGLGLDEDTAAIVEGPQITVIGSNAVTIVDGSELEHSGMGYVRQGQAVSLIGLHLHILVDGGIFRIDQRRAYAAHTDTQSVDSEQLAAADSDVQVGRALGYGADDIGDLRDLQESNE